MERKDIPIANEISRLFTEGLVRSAMFYYPLELLKKQLIESNDDLERAFLHGAIFTLDWLRGEKRYGPEKAVDEWRDKTWFHAMLAERDVLPFIEV